METLLEGEKVLEYLEGALIFFKCFQESCEYNARDWMRWIWEII